MNIPTMLLNQNPEPIPSYRFSVYVQALRMGFSKITNIEESIETDTLQEGGVNDRVYSLRKPVTRERTLVLERGVAARGVATMALAAQFGVGNRLHTGMLIIIHKRNGEIGYIYEAEGPVVKKMSLSPLDSMGGQVLIETFEVAYEKIKQLPPIGLALNAAGVGGL